MLLPLRARRRAMPRRKAGLKAETTRHQACARFSENGRIIYAPTDKIPFAAVYICKKFGKSEKIVQEILTFPKK